MNTDFLPLYCHPLNHEPLTLVSETSPSGKPIEMLESIPSREKFMIRDGIPVFVKKQPDKENQQFYNFIAPLYDKIHNIQGCLRGGESQLRTRFLSELDVKPGDLVLEAAIGTGANLRHLPRAGRYFGVDISWEMLKHCRAQAKEKNRPVNLCLADAQYLPYKNDTFDTVFNFCGLRLIKNPTQAIREMIRVAKPGAKILIVDQKKAGIPINLLPPNVQEVQVNKKQAWDLYCLTFRKPQPAKPSRRRR